MGKSLMPHRFYMEGKVMIHANTESRLWWWSSKTVHGRGSLIDYTTKMWTKVSNWWGISNGSLSGFIVSSRKQLRFTSYRHFDTVILHIPLPSSHKIYIWFCYNSSHSRFSWFLLPTLPGVLQLGIKLRFLHLCPLTTIRLDSVGIERVKEASSIIFPFHQSVGK